MRDSADHWRQRLGALLVSTLLSGLVGVSSGWAVTTYSYLDDQGNLVATDAPGTIPDRFRSRVKIHERPDPAVTAPSFLHSLRHSLDSEVMQIGWKLPVFHIEGLTPDQSKLLTSAGGLALCLVVVMYISKSPLVRLLCLGLLIVLVIGTPLLVYVSDGGPMDVMKSRAAAAGHARHDRLEQIGK